MSFLFPISAGYPHRPHCPASPGEASGIPDSLIIGIPDSDVKYLISIPSYFLYEYLACAILILIQNGKGGREMELHVLCYFLEVAKE